MRGSLLSLRVQTSGLPGKLQNLISLSGAFAAQYRLIDVKAIVFILGTLAGSAVLAAPPPVSVSSLHAFPGASNQPPVVLFNTTNRLQLHSFPYRVLTNAPKALAAGRSSPGTLTPGVYETAPYTCIVVVPKEHPDKMAVGRGAEQAIEMPTVMPDLRFIPRSSKAK
jgi:hypothetical protein